MVRRSVVRGVAAALLAAAVGFDLTLAGSARSSGVPAAVAITIAVLLLTLSPVVFLLPGRRVEVDVDARALRAELDATAKQFERSVALAAPTSLHQLGAGLLRVRHELGRHQRRLAAAARSGVLWPFTDQGGGNEVWAQVRDCVSVGALADAGLYTVLADAYSDIARLARGNAVRLLAGHPPQVAPGDRLEDALAAVTTACDTSTSCSRSSPNRCRGPQRRPQRRTSRPPPRPDRPASSGPAAAGALVPPDT